MAKQTVTYSCGHSEMVTLFGPHADRDRKIAWMEREGLCSECYKAHKQAERDAANKSAAADNASNGMAALEGTDKQIAWAESIRAKALDKAVSPDVIDAAAKTDEERSVATWYRARHTELTAQGSAKWWIEHQDVNLGREVRAKIKK